MLKDIKKDWNACTKIKIFEFEVIDKRNGNDDILLFDIDIVGRSFIAKHVALTKKQEKSKLVATTKLVIDTDFSLDENLQELYETCITAINSSDFYMIWDDYMAENFVIYRLPAYYACYLINADSSNLIGDESEKLDDFITNNNLGLCTGTLWDEASFYRHNALDSFGADCLHYIFERRVK